MDSGSNNNLASFVAAHGGGHAIRVEENLGGGYVRLRVDEAERRQAKNDIRCVEDIVIEMLRNSRDAGARRIFVATAREGDVRSLVVLDDGKGIPRDMHEKVFDARVTSKLESAHMDKWGIHGRGMALYAVREACETARVAASGPGMGCSIQVTDNVSKLPERKDQSTWPTLGKGEDGGLAVERGPHNIIRTCCEFALVERGVCDVWVGSPAEIIATVRARLHPAGDDTRFLFVDNIEELPVLERLFGAGDASELLQAARSVGLDISERTAHRIMAGQIRPVRSTLSRMTHKSDTGQGRTPDLERDRRGMKIAPGDLFEFQRAMERDFSTLADKYYLTLSREPRIRVSRGQIVVSFDVKEDD